MLPAEPPCRGARAAVPDLLACWCPAALALVTTHTDVGTFSAATASVQRDQEKVKSRQMRNRVQDRLRECV